jgi:hypothetical protein
VDELDLTLVPAFPSLPGEDTAVLSSGRTIGDHFAWLSDADRASYDAAEQAFRKLAASVDPDDPWSHPDAARLDRVSVGQWLRATGATPDAVRARDLAMLALAVVCAIPVGPLRRVAIDGVSRERLASLDRQRHALAAKVCFAYERSWWEEQGQNGSMYFETGMLGGLWPQREGILSALVPPERLAAFLATSPALVEQDVLAELVEAMGERARDPLAVFFRRWGVDPWTEGYITAWRPGDVMAVGPLHGTHEPPFYVCGSDQWVCGYMEGAVRTGRAAAAAALGTYVR